MAADPTLEALGAALLVGTSKASVPPVPELGAEGGEARRRAGPDPDGAAGALLDLSALAALRKRAGAKWPSFEGPEPESPRPLSAEPSTRAASVAAARILADLLERPRSQALLPTWLGACQRARHEVPASLLPPLLDLAARDSEFRDAVSAVVGARGRWLAHLEPRWTFVLAPGDVDPRALEVQARQAEAPEPRAAAMTALHRSAPEHAAQLLVELWPSLGARDKLGCIEGMRPPSPLLEETLEGALDERAKTVRALAADTLSRLPGSRLQQRMEARLERLLELEGDRLRLVLPVDLAKGVERDGIVRAPPSAPHGRRAAWAEQILSRVPPGRVAARFGLSARQLLDAVERGPSRAGLLLGLSAATVRHADVTWATALLERGAPSEPELLALLPGERREAFAKRRLGAAAHPEALHRALLFTTALPGPVSTSLARAALKSLERLGGARHPRAFPVYGVLRWVALHGELDDPHGPSLTSAWAAFGRSVAETSPWRGAFEESLELLRERRAIVRSFPEDPSSESPPS